MSRLIHDITTSDRVDKLSVHAERFFMRFLLCVDDMGNFNYNLDLIKSGCFPLKPAVRKADISLWIEELQSIGIIAFYEAEAKRFIHVHDFRQQLKYPKAKFPLSPFDVQKEKSTKKEKGSDIEEKRSEGETQAPAPTPLNDTYDQFRVRCFDYAKKKFAKYFKDIQQPYAKFEKDLAERVKTQVEYNDAMEKYISTRIMPAIRKEFDLFFDYYSAKGWHINDTPITDKYSQWKVWLRRKK